MRQYFVDFGDPVEGYEACVEHVGGSFETGKPVHVAGNKEGVDVAFELKVFSMCQRRTGLKKILEFSGITEPAREPYSADFDETLPSQRISLRIHTASHDMV